MTRRLLGSLVLASLVVVLTSIRAEDQIPLDTKKVRTTGTADGDFDPKKLELEHQQLKAKFLEFRQDLLRLAQTLENSSLPSDKDRAKILRDVLKSASEKPFDANFNKLIEKLRSKDVKNDLPLLTEIKETNEQLRRDLKLLVDMLRDNPLERLKAERRDLEKMLEQLKDVIRKQERIRAQTELGKQDSKDIAKAQDQVNQAAKNLIGEGKNNKGNEAAKTGEAKPDGDKNGKPGENDRGKGKEDTAQVKGDPKTQTGKEGKPNEGKPNEGKPGEGAKDGKPGEGKPGEGKPGESKPGEGKPGEGKPNAGKPSEGKPGEGKPSEGKPGEGKPGEGKPMPGQPMGGKPSEGKPGQGKESGQPMPGQPSQGKPGEGKPSAGQPMPGQPGQPGQGKEGAKPQSGQPMPMPMPGQGKQQNQPAENKGKGDNKAENKPSGKEGGQPMAGQPSQGQGKPSEGQPSQGQGKPSQGQPGQPGQPSQPGQPGQPGQPPQQKEDQQHARKKIQEGAQSGEKATQDLKKEDKPSASDNQDDAAKKYKEAQKKLEELLRQIREEEIERLLAALQARCEEMLRMQKAVYDGTLDVDGRKKGEKNELTLRQLAQQAVDLGAKEEDIVKLANISIRLIEEEGSAVAFAAVFSQVRDDMENVSKRLRATDAGQITQTIEKDIIATLEEMIDALKKEQKKNKEKKSKPSEPKPSDPKNQQQDLIDLIAELKMIKAMQVRVNKRTEDYHKFYPDLEQAPPVETIPDMTKKKEIELVQDELKNLANRQDSIHKITSDIAKGKNKTSDR